MFSNKKFKSTFKFLWILTVAIAVRSSNALACDLCAIYSAQNIRDSQANKVTVGATEQFTSFNSVRLNGEWVPNEAHQSMSSSVTQLYGRYDFSDSTGVQLTLPYISRDFKRPAGSGIEKGNESGIGDASILGLYTPVRVTQGDFFGRLSFRGGLKLPTGDASRIKEETEESEEDASGSSDVSHETERSHEQLLAHAGNHGGETDQIPSGIHGHDLALGSGSLDYIIGATGFVEEGSQFAMADLQYAIRTEGDYNYRYQNDLVWNLGVGQYLLTDDASTVSLKCNLSGEYKGMDIFEGNKADDTGINSVFLGPELNVTGGDQIFGLVAFDLPVILDNTAFQAVPDYRVRVGLTYRF